MRYHTTKTHLLKGNRDKRCWNGSINLCTLVRERMVSLRALRSLPCTPGIHQTWTRWLISPHYKGNQASYISKQIASIKAWQHRSNRERAALISNTVRFLFSRLIGAGLLPARVRQGVSDTHDIISCHYHECNMPAFCKQINEQCSISKRELTD